MLIAQHLENFIYSSSGTFLLPMPKASATSEIRHDMSLFQKSYTLILLCLEGH